jgi:hypothetical protein
MRVIDKLKNENIIAFIVCLGFWLFVYLKSGLITAGFQLVDDHEVVRATFYLQEHNILQLFGHFLSTDFEIRFRPVYYICWLCQYLAYHDNWALWHLQVLATSVFTSFLLYLTGRNLGYNFFLSLLFVFLSLVGLHSDIWIRVGPAETLGMFLLSGAFYTLSLKNQSFITKTAFAALLVLASMAKESFLIVMPAMVFLYNWLEAKNQNKPFWRTVKGNLTLNAVLAAICLLEVFIIVKFIGATSTYKVANAGISAASFNISALYQAYLELIQEGWTIILLNILAVLFFGILAHNYLIKKDKSLNGRLLQEILPVVVFFILFVVPEIILYAKSGWLYRYMNPAILGLYVVIIGFLNFIVSYIKENFGKLLKILSFFIIGVGIFLLLYIKTYHAVYLAEHWAGKCVKTTSALEMIKETTAKGANNILLIADPAKNYEQSHSLRLFIKYLTGKKLDYILPLCGTTNLKPHAVMLKEAYQLEFAEEISNFAKTGGDIDKMDIVISFKNLKDETEGLFKDNGNFSPKDFGEIVIYVKD